MRALRPAAFTAAALVSLIAAAPAQAADTNGGSASAVTLSVAGQDAVSGTYTAQYDGRKTTSGNNRPAIGVLGGQSLISAGTLAQDADADASGSRACAGLAGQGATVAAVGSGSCLVGGNVLNLDAGHVDLSSLQLASGTIADQFPQQLKNGLSQLTGGIAPVTTALSDGLKQGLQAFGNPGLSFQLGAVEGVCSAGDGGPQGEARLVNAQLVATPPAQSGQGPITLLTLPAKPAPNTSYSADLGKLSELLLADLKANLEQSFQGNLKQLVPVADQAAAINSVLTQVSQQLQPLTSKVISVTANEQSRTASSIDLTALDVKLLPGAVQGVDAFHLRVGHVTCGPTTQAAAAAPAQTVTPKKAALPRAVSAGEAGTPAPGPFHGPIGLALTGLAVLAAGSVGLAGWRGAKR